MNPRTTSILVFCIALTLGSSLWPARAQNDVLAGTAVSQGSGIPFSAECDVGDVLIGLDVFQDKKNGFLSYVRAVCEKVDAQGNLGAGYGRYLGWYTGFVPAGQGTTQKICRAGWVAAGMAATKTSWSSSEINPITTLNLVCKQWDAATRAFPSGDYKVLSIAAFSAAVEDDHNFGGCGSNLPMKGVRGVLSYPQGATSHVDAVQMVCYSAVCKSGTACSASGLM